MKIKKVLMLAHPEMDHLAYMMYNGLYKILGKDNLSIYPFVKHYQGGIDDWYILDNGQKGYTKPPGYIGKHETPERSFDYLTDNINSFDVIYLSSGRTYAVKALDQFIARCGNNIPPLIFSEGEDYQDLITIRNIKNKYHPKVCFKRELLQSDLDKNPDLQPLYPLPFSAITDNLPSDNRNKDIDVFAIFGDTWPIREDIVRLVNTSQLSKKYKIHVGIDHFISDPNKLPGCDQRDFNIPPLSPYSKYLDLMSRSKINLIARGWGYDTLRRFEASCFSGLVMSDSIPIMMSDPFIDNQHIIYYNNNLSDLINRIEYYLNSPSERERIGKSGMEHCFKFHTNEARTRYFLNKIELHQPT